MIRFTCEIYDNDTVLVHLPCSICGVETTRMVTWEWAAAATDKDYEDIALCMACMGEPDIKGDLNE